MPGETFGKVAPPKEQGVSLRLPWSMWIAIRDLGRKHERSAVAEIRAAVSYWLELEEHRQMWERSHQPE